MSAQTYTSPMIKIIEKHLANATANIDRLSARIDKINAENAKRDAEYQAAEERRRAEREEAEKRWIAERDAEAKRRLAEEAKRRAEREEEAKRRLAEEAKRRAEREEAEKRRLAEEAKRRAEREEADKRRRAEREEADKKYLAEREAAEKERRESERRLNKQMGDLGLRFGEMTEHLIAPNLRQKFNALGFHFENVSTNVSVETPDDAYEIDLFLENGDDAAAVEVKAKLTVGDVKDHVERMKKIRRNADRRGDKRKFLGAVAGAIIPKNVREFALNTGFYVVEQAGDTVNIVAPKAKAKEW